MGKYINPDVYDGALNVIKNNATKQVACSAEPTTYSEGATTYMLAEVTMADTDFTIANGDAGGRKVTVAAKAGVTISNSGTATHIALLDVTGSRLLAVTTCDSLVLTAGGGNTVSFPSWKTTLPAPV